MTVYIEYVIIDNFVLTYLISILSQRLTRVRPGRLRAVLASLIGTAAALFYPFLGNIIAIFALRAVLFAAMALILFPIRKLFRGAVSFIAVTFAFGGAFFAVGYAVHGDLIKALTLPAFDFPFGIVAAGAAVLFVIAKRLVSKLLKRGEAAGYLYTLKISAFGKTAECTGFMDSGNRLCDPVSGLPVVVLSLNKSLALLSEEDGSRLITGRGEGIEGARYVSFTSVGSQRRKMLLVKPEYLLVYNEDKANILYDVMIGLSLNAFKDAEKYDAILSPAVIKECL